ncbi:hypothetical protein GQ600_138 [Phytophthora cactorum]|nr:hypothetical protein GQ600_138 [Phytophthora cactorum]
MKFGHVIEVHAINSSEELTGRKTVVTTVIAARYHQAQQPRGREHHDVIGHGSVKIFALDNILQHLARRFKQSRKSEQLVLQYSQRAQLEAVTLLFQLVLKSD